MLVIVIIIIQGTVHSFLLKTALNLQQ